MRILAVSQGFYPDNYHINHIVEDMQQRGHKVTVLTGLPDYTTGKVPKEYKYFRRHRDCLGRAEVWRVPIIARRSGVIMRFLNYLSFAVSGSIFCAFKKFEPFDVIYVWGVSPVTMAIPAIALKKRFKKPIFFYCLDLWPESMKAFNVSDKNPVFTAVKILCRWIYKRFDKVAITSKPFASYIEEINGYPKDKIIYLPQYGAQEYLQKDFGAKDNGVTDFLWAGNIGYAQNLDCLIKAVEKIKDEPSFKVHIAGDGSAKKFFEKMTEEKFLTDKIVFCGRVPYAQMQDFYRLADACLLTLDGASKIGDTLPVKMQGYMAAGKAVLASVNGAGAQIIEESGCGLCVGAGDSEGLAKIMLEFMRNKEKYLSCGEKAREYYKKHFTKEKHFEILEAELKELIKI